MLASIAAKGIVLADFDPEALAACAARVREVTLAAGVQSPVPRLMMTLLQHLTSAIGPEAASRLILSEHLADEDRAVVRTRVWNQPPARGAGTLIAEVSGQKAQHARRVLVVRAIVMDGVDPC
ncbi:MAG: hypothetical protein M5T61_18780 [Acidimicrobiia bacterium]|nr:hypothetical protein [Acidimicrobiia bacterium]